MDNISNYIALGFTIAGVLVTAASTIVALTPTQKDDAILAKVIAVLNVLSVFNPKGHVVVKTEETK